MKKEDPEPFTSPPFPHKGPQITKPLENKPLKTKQRTVDVLSNDGEVAQLVWSDNPNDKFTRAREQTGTSVERFLEIYPPGHKKLRFI